MVAVAVWAPTMAERLLTPVKRYPEDTVGLYSIWSYAMHRPVSSTVMV